MRKSTPRKELIAVPESLHPDLSDDEQKKRDLEEALRRDLRLLDCNIDVEVHGEEATLIGSLPSSTARMAADFDAQAVRGIGHVRNRLTVIRPDREPLIPTEKTREDALRRMAAEE